MIYVLDTHALVWHLTDSPSLGQRANELMLDPAITLVVPAMALVEVRYLSMRDRIRVALDEVLQFVEGDPRCSIHPVDESVARYIPAGLNIHDAVICATALLLADSTSDVVEVITRDNQIIASGLVSTVW